MNHYIHFQASTGALRTALVHGQETLIVPVTALIESVIHPINAPSPEYVSRDVLARDPCSWNGTPLVLGHPSRDGKQISASTPGVLEERGFGVIRNARVVNGRLLCDAHINLVAAERIGADRLLQRLRDPDDKVEVSVGAYVTVDPTPGIHNGKRYGAIWKTIVPDHIAVLEHGRGACSVEMGCGCNRDPHKEALHQFDAPDPYAAALKKLRAANAKADPYYARLEHIGSQR